MTKLIQYTRNTVAILALTASSFGVFAADEYNSSKGLTAAGAPLGLHGSDPVAFLELGNRQTGTAAYTQVHDGVAYYFSSKANAKKFKKNPTSFTPQNGGFCTFGVSVGKKFDGDPKFAAVVDNKLYVFLNEEIFNAFQKDIPGTISKAEKNWQKIQHTAAADL